DNSVQGTCVIHRRHFDLVGGYDDVLTNYGGEDLELYERLALAKVEKRIIDAGEVVEVIDHGPADRTRFFDKRPDAGFLIGKVYRVAIGLMTPTTATHVTEPQLR